jgi:hypothetical protein
MRTGKWMFILLLHGSQSFFIFLVLNLSAMQTSIFAEDFPFIQNLNYENPELQKIREDIKLNLHISRGGNQTDPLRLLRQLIARVLLRPHDRRGAASLLLQGRAPHAA